MPKSEANRRTKGRKAGRPPTLTMPEPIPDSLENVMDAVVTTPTKKRSEWKYLQQQKGSAYGASNQTG